LARHTIRVDRVAAGMERAALEVDETSNTGATEVYRRLGFGVTMRLSTA
jgi:hypothetical protein